MKWILASGRLPDTYDQHEKHYRLDGKRSNGFLLEAEDGGVVFEHRPGASYEIIDDLSRVEWLDESPSPLSSGAVEIELIMHDTLCNEMVEVGSAKDARDYVYAEYVEGTEMHPDFDSFPIYQKVGDVSVKEDDKGNATKIEATLYPSLLEENKRLSATIKNILEHIDTWPDEPVRAIRLINSELNQ